MGDAPTTRRAFLLASAYGLTSIGRDNGLHAEDWPPVFETERSQFRVISPRTKLAPFELRNLAGRVAPIATIDGQIMLVNLWATWCYACRADLQHLARLNRQNRPNLAIVPICTDTWVSSDIRAFLKEIGADDLPSYIDPTGTIASDRDSSSELFRTPKIPMTYLIGRSGFIEGSISGAADWTSAAGGRLLNYYGNR